MVETTEAYTFLDNLRESGVTNMFGAGQYVEEAFSIGKTEARKFLSGWMEAVESGKWDMDKHEFTDKIEA